MRAAELSRLAEELGIDVVGAAPVSAYEQTESHIRERQARGLFAEYAASLIAGSRLRRVFRRGQVERAVLCRNVDLEKLQIVGARNDVMRDAGRL